MRQPNMENPDWLCGMHKTQKEVGGTWVLARPENPGANSWTWRWKLAWLVLIGRCDALKWTGQ